MHFELVAKRLLDNNVVKAKEPLLLLLLKVFKAGFELGKNGKTEIEL